MFWNAIFCNYNVYPEIPRPDVWADKRSENIEIAIGKTFLAHVTEEMSEGVFLAPNFILQWIFKRNTAPRRRREMLSRGAGE